MPVRAREIGINIGRGKPGKHNAITDVPGVKVGHVTLIEGKGKLVVGKGPVRTGVTMILGHPGHPFDEPLYAGAHWFNGNGELTGMAWIQEFGLLTSPIALTNSSSVGVVRDAIGSIEASMLLPEQNPWSLPVVGETWDAALNDMAGGHVKPEHVWEAFRKAKDGPVAEGNVGGGTAQIAFGFKSGIGTASRKLPDSDGGWTVGVLLQANHGRRDNLTVLGAPVGEEIPATAVPFPQPPEATYRPGAGSIPIIVATDAPLLPHQCQRLARRAGIGMLRSGGLAENDSGDLFFAFSTANRGKIPGPNIVHSPLKHDLTVLTDAFLDPIFEAAAEATEEAILNSLLMAETMTGRDNVTAHALPPALLLKILAKYKRGPRPAGS
ncbi:DmpA family aminopeptidase [Streptoalloteichus hindustanus]|uniref:L-aminopeptidase DmpA. Serine peptidase. MEROPS family S58 n=1 Tax=Streptoalloteichus hindustanus TaxID=2017 RepID=A0A1M5FAR9_STRHI|nr:P1 family peptidase [Streptoalloteichus hindustanus]SHF88645.1 L-aminopeptidase DmpA. Serine peptidase. MEROPS family S58 [Streptoalloteichus hindustanus]